MISLAVTAMFGLSLAAGWQLFACLMSIGGAGLAVLIYEIRHAIELPPDFDIGPSHRGRRKYPRRWSGRLHSFSFFA